jgi:hypothetical protein
MIKEEEIARFPSEKQLQIRAEIADREKSGYEREFLILADSGSVLYDRETVWDADIRKALGKLVSSGPNT